MQGEWGCAEPTLMKIPFYAVVLVRIREGWVHILLSKKKKVSSAAVSAEATTKATATATATVAQTRPGSASMCNLLWSA